MNRCLTILVLGCLVFVSAAGLACEEPVIPEVPNPELASDAEMLRAQVAVKRYIALQEEFLECARHAPREHNRAVDRMHEVANKYNSAARRYKTRMQARNMFTELVLLDMSRF